MREIYTAKDKAYFAREHKMIIDPFGRIHFVDKFGIWEYMGGR